MREKIIFILYCYTVFAPIFSYTVFYLFKHTEFAQKIGIQHCPLPNYIALLSIILCCTAVIISIVVFIFGNIHQKIGTIVPFVLAFLYVSLWVAIYYTIV